MINTNIIYILSFIFFCFVHSMNGWLPGANEYFQFLTPLIPAIVCISIQFIILSGYNLRKSLNVNSDTNKVTSQVWPLIQTFILFFLIDNFKKAIGVKASYFYQWSVLQTVFLSLTIILLLARVSINLVLVIGFIVYLIANPVNYFLLTQWSPLQADFSLLNEFHYYSFIAIILVYAFVYLKISQSKMTKKYKAMMSLSSLSIVLFLLAAVFAKTDLRAEDIYIVRNLWLGILTPDPLVYHSYPMMTWFPIIVGGFLIADMHIRSKKAYLYINVIGFMGLVVFLYFTYAFYVQSQLDQFTIEYFIRTVLSNDRWNNQLVYMLSLFCFLLLVSTLIGQSMTRINRIGSIISGGMIYIFIFITAVGQSVCTYIGTLLPIPYSQLVATIVLCVLGLFVGYLVEIAVNKKYEISFKKVK